MTKEPQLQGEDESSTLHGHYNSDGAPEGELSDVISNLNLNDYEEKDKPQEQQTEPCGRSDASQKELERRLVAEKKMAELQKLLADSQAENVRLNREKMDTKRLHVLELRKTGDQILVLIDADGSVFNPGLIQLGKKGGEKAADMLIAGIRKDLPNHLVVDDSITVLAFQWFEGVCKRLVDNNFCDPRSFHEFVEGFTGARAGFAMIHVNAKADEAEKKIKYHLQNAMRSRSIYKKVYFAGCHDHGYIPALEKYAKLPHLRDKLILLLARSDTSRTYNVLMKSLRPMRITELFHPNNIPYVWQKSHTTGQGASSAPAVPPNPPLTPDLPLTQTQGTHPTGAPQVPASHSTQVPPHGASTTLVNIQDDTGTTCTSISQPQSASPGEDRFTSDLTQGPKKRKRTDGYETRSVTPTEPSYRSSPTC